MGVTGSSSLVTPRWLAGRGLEPFDAPAAFLAKALPQRSPLLLVDRVLGVRWEPPAVAAALVLTGDEPVFAGHFPDRPLWPGSHTIEGLAQTCALVGALLAYGPRAGALPAAEVTPAFLVAVRVKLTASITPPARLEYFAALTHRHDGICRFDVEAVVDGKSVATGTLDVHDDAPSRRFSP